MAIDWTKIEPLINEKAIQFTGRQAELIKFTNSGTDYNPSRAEQAPIDVWITESKRSVTWRDADIVQVGDRVLIMAVPTGGEVPEPGDVIRDDVDYNVKDVHPTKPGGTVLVYKLLVGK